MLYDPITGIKTLGREKVQTTVSALKAGAGYPIEWIHDIVEFPDGKLVIVTHSLRRFKINRDKVLTVQLCKAIRKCKDKADVELVQKMMGILNPEQLKSIPKNILDMFENKKNSINHGEEIHVVEKKEVKREKDKEYPFLTLCENHNILLDCHKVYLKDIRTGEYQKSYLRYFWITKAGIIKEIAEDAAVVKDPKTVAALARHKHTGGTDIITPSVNKIIRIHNTYAD